MQGISDALVMGGFQLGGFSENIQCAIYTVAHICIQRKRANGRASAQKERDGDTEGLKRWRMRGIKCHS